MYIETPNTLQEVPTDGSAVFPIVDGNIPPSFQEGLEAALKTLNENKNIWATMKIEDRIALLDQIKLDLVKVSDLWMDKTFEAKGINSNPFGQIEERVIFASLFRMLRVLRKSLSDIQKYGRPKIPGSIQLAPNGQVVVPVFPQSLKDQIFYQGVSGEVWMQPGITKDDVERNQAKSYRKSHNTGQIVIVLVAGNLGLLPFGDLLHKLFVEKNVVILKMNPVNDYLGPLLEEGFATLVEGGFLRILYGGADVGRYLCNHSTVDEIHITGSDKTFDAILFGTGPEAANRKKNGKPLLQKSMTGELGNITPVIVMPGEWSDEDIQLQAARIASWLAYNAGCNCLTPRMVIQHKEWGCRDRLLEAIGDAFDKIPTREAYYPGAKRRHKSILNAHPDAQLRGKPGPGHLPWTLVTNLDPENREDICFRLESFYSQLSETAINADSVPDFIGRAVEFANNTLWGNLIALLIVHPKSLQDSKVKNAFEHAIAGLKYGTICINFFTGMAYTMGTTPFGAFPGNEISDIQSGIGFVGNYLMLENTQKSVYRAQFRNIREPTIYSSKMNMDFSRMFTECEINPSWLNLSKLGIALMQI